MILIGNRYEIVQEIDFLAENRRYECIDTKNRNKKYFIKIIDNGNQYLKENFVANLIDEKMLIDEIASPYILKVEDIGIHSTVSGDLIYIVSEYMKGIDLDELIKGDYLHYDGLVKISVQIVRALHAYSKRNRRYHGSLKPESILVDEEYNIKIDDFGVTYANSGVNIRTGNNIMYMAPSQMSVDYSDMKSDFFTLGIIFYGALYKRYPFIRTNDENIRLKSIDMNMNAVPPALLEKHDRFVSIVEKLLSRDKNEKYKNIVELMKDLTDIMYSEISKEYVLEEEKIDFEAHLDKTGRLSPDILYKTGKIDTELVKKLAEEQRIEREKKKIAKEKLEEKQQEKLEEKQREHEIREKNRMAKIENEKKNREKLRRDIEKFKQEVESKYTQNLPGLAEEIMEAEAEADDEMSFTSSIFFKVIVALIVLLIALIAIAHFI